MHFYLSCILRYNGCLNAALRIYDLSKFFGSIMRRALKLMRQRLIWFLTCLFLLLWNMWDNFLGHASFCMRFIKNFAKMTWPLTNLLATDTPFNFDESFTEAFETLQAFLVLALIVQPLNFFMPFNLSLIHIWRCRRRG